MFTRENASPENNVLIKKPKMYNVIMHNDDYTTMHFVVEILISVFHKQAVDASNLMMQIHKSGKAIVGTYIYDMAITKKLIADQMSAQNQYPLKITIDEAIEWI